MKIGDSAHILKIAMFMAAVIIAVMALKKPRVALYGALVAAAFDRSLDVGGLQLVLTTTALAMFVPAFAREWSARLTPTSVKVGSAALLGGSALATVVAADWHAAIIGTLNWALVLNMVLGGMGIVGRDQRTLRALALWVSALGALVGVLGWLQSKGHYTIVGPPYVQDRIDSSFGYYSNFANFEALAAVVALGLFIKAVAERQWGVASTTGLCTLASGYAVAIALSRGAVLLLGVGVVVLLAVRLARPAALIGTSLVLAVLGFVVYASTPEATRLEFISRFTDTQGGDALRGQLQNAGGEILQQTPGGLGFDNFRRLIESGIVVADAALAHAHDLFIQIGLDTGWLGLFGFVLLMTVACLRGLRLGLRSGGRALQVAFAAALIGFLVQGLNDYFFFETGSLVMFSVLVLGAVAPTSEPVAKGADRVEKTDEVPRVGVTARSNS